MMDVAGVQACYRAMKKADPTGAAAARYVAQLTAAGLDPEEIWEAIAASDASPTTSKRVAAPPRAAPPRAYAPGDGTEVATHVASAQRDRWGRPVVAVRHALQGQARRDFERMFGGAATPAAWGELDLDAPPDEVGSRRTRDGALQISLGCPGEYRRSLAGRKGGPR
jgi:hypothetical protein